MQNRKKPLISARHLTVAYDTPVLVSVDFDIERGDFICLVGAHGAGKSTLVKTILGFKRPAHGTISFVDHLTRTTIGYLPQETHVDRHFPATVSEIVLSGALGRHGFKPFYSQKDRDNLASTLKTLGLTKLKDRSFTTLSGGQKQKVLLARALMATSEVLILDEPTGSLDHQSRADFYQILKDLNASGLTIIMITHDLDAADLIGNRVFAIKSGKLICETTAKFLRGYR